MSALRVSVPGRAVELIPLGPARGRLTVHAYSSLGGPIDSEPRKTNAQHQRTFVERHRDTDRCGLLMPKGGICGERLGHRRHCRARA